MPQTCKVCNNRISIFYIWTSDRYFPLDRLIEKLNISKNEIRDFVEGMPVCISCYKKLRGCK